MNKPSFSYRKLIRNERRRKAKRKRWAARRARR